MAHKMQTGSGHAFNSTVRVYERGFSDCARILRGMDSLSALVLVWLIGLFLLVGVLGYARIFTYSPRWFTVACMVLLVVLCVPIVLAAQGADVWLVWALLGLGYAGLIGAFIALLRGEARDKRLHK